MRIIVRIVVVFLLLVFVWIGLLASKWLPRTTDVQRRSLALLEAPPVTTNGQRNAFAAIWLWQYDIPMQDLGKVAAIDIARYRVPEVGLETPRFIPYAEGRYPREALPTEAKLILCGVHEEHCLAKIRRNVNAVKSLLEKYSLLIDHSRALDSYDHFHYLFPPSVDDPTPSIGALGSLQVTDAAMRFVDGDQADGLARACLATRTQRRLATHSDHLLIQMLGVANSLAAADLFADMLAEIPSEMPLPPSCTNAFELVSDSDINICDSAKNEYRAYGVVWNQISDPNSVQYRSHKLPGKLFVKLMANGRAAKDLAAPGFASYCSKDPDIQREAARTATASNWRRCGIQGALFNPIQCLYVPDTRDGHELLSKYPSRLRNLQAMNKLISAALILRSASSVSSYPVVGNNHVVGTMPLLPAGVTIDSYQQMLRIKRAYVRIGESEDFTIPLPASRLH